MLGNSWVDERLAASQEGLISRELFSSYIKSSWLTHLQKMCMDTTIFQIILEKSATLFGLSQDPLGVRDPQLETPCLKGLLNLVDTKFVTTWIRSTLRDLNNTKRLQTTRRAPKILERTSRRNKRKPVASIVAFLYFYLNVWVSGFWCSG
jgi:hypothetical protein